MLLAAAVGVLFAAAPVSARSSEDAWDHAVDLRTQLEADAGGQRTKADFEQVLDAFRRIYHQNPNAAKAPAAVAAVADLLAEKGRVLGDQRALRAAIGQYEFLRQQYPDSPQVESALLLEGEICRQDLKDTVCAEEKLHAVIAAGPGSSFAEQAALELKELEPASASNGSAGDQGNAAKTIQKTGQNTGRKTSQETQAVAPVSSANPIDSAAIQDPAKSPVSPAAQTGRTISSGSSGRVVMITGMRHWSNPTSTRIAIDLGGKVEYEAARVPNPDRIFFDLHGAKLAPSLNGHQVEVVDDGYLKRIRAAQFHPDVTRVVLDVTDVSEYSAFLLPNPWRLIIDVHSDKGATKSAIARNRATADETLPNGNEVPTVSATPNTIGTATGRTGRQRNAAPATPGVESDNTISDVAKLSTEPARIAATAGPTSGPVSVRVPSGDDGRSSDTGALSPQTALPSSESTGRKGRKKGKSSPTASSDESAIAAAVPHAADPTADGQRSLVRALGLKVGRIVIDAGHGGHDSGTLGPGGIQEKDVVLDVALRVGKLLHQRLGAEIVYTRDDDTFIPLETRTAIANKAQADLFLSIHGNSSPEPSARGVETYYLNFTSDPNALDVAARENAVSSQSVHQLSDLVRKITLKDKIDESREFAADVDAGLYAGLKAGNPGLRDRGVKKAPFVVLIGAQMPSILAEISFLTNPDDAAEMLQGSYRQRIAESLDAGVERYLRGLSGTGPRGTGPRETGQATRQVEKATSSAKTAPGEEPAGN